MLNKEHKRFASNELFIRWLIALLLIIVNLPLPNNVEAQDSNPVTTPIFGRVIHDLAPLYQKIDQEYIPFQPVNNLNLYEDSLQRILLIDDQWAQILPDPGPREGSNGYLPWRNAQNINTVYMRQEDLEIIDDFEPLSVLTNTQPEDKLAVLIQSEQPHLVLFEQSQVIAKIPIVLGRFEDGRSLTPLGFMHVYSGYTTKNMGQYTGVPFSLFLGGINTKTNGEAFHTGYWWDWNEVDEGWYASHGCINLPEFSKYNVFWEGEELSFGHWFFRWARTNLQFNPYTEESYSEPQTDWFGTDWYVGDDTLRVISVQDITDLTTYPNGDGSHEWQSEIEAYQSLPASVRLPRLSPQNQSPELIDLEAQDLPFR